MKVMRVVLLVVLVAGLALAVQSPVRAQDDNGRYDNFSCQSLSAGSPYMLSSSGGPYGYFAPGPYVFSVSLGTATSATVSLVNGLGTTYAGPASVPATVVVDMSTIPQPTWLALFIDAIEPAGATLIVSVSCGGGCDTQIPIPEQAVSGHFNSNSEIYWAPGEQVSPMIYVELGNTYYVAGQDESETYYKVLIACDWVWVRKDTVGPNYDPVWQGRPLPQDIVK